MIGPRKWHLKRPGFCIPVFFLSICQVFGQSPYTHAGSSALGGCVVTGASAASALYNPAGLARLGEGAVSLSHSRPFMLKELGLSQLCGALPMERGGFGLGLCHMGLPGLHESSMWLSCGMKVGPDIFAGAGYYLEDLYMGEGRHGVSMGCAFGLQAQLTPSLFLGLHLLHPVSLPSFQLLEGRLPMQLRGGLSYTFFDTATCFSELSYNALSGIQWALGWEIGLAAYLDFLLGWNSLSSRFSAGLCVRASPWSFILSMAGSSLPGLHPTCTLSYAW